MARQLVVVVHGVGVKDAGISADLLATALDDTPEKTTTIERDAIASPRLRPHSSDDFHQREFELYNEGGKRQVFPARIRRYRQYDAQNDKTINERVIADFYWGDIATIGGSSFSLLRGILTTVLGLSHIVRESASEVFRGIDWWNRTMRQLANIAVLTIHGPIAAINIVLLAGVATAFLFKQTLDSGGGHWSAFVAGLVTLVAAVIFRARAKAYLARHLWFWTGLTALALAAFALLGAMKLDGGLNGLDTYYKFRACYWQGAKLEESAGCILAYDGLFTLGLRLLRLMELAWVLVLICAVALWVGELRYNRRKPRDPETSLVVPALSAMMLLWILMIGCVWAAIVQFAPGVIPHKYQLASELAMLVVVLGVVALLGAASAWAVLTVRSFVKNHSPETYLGSATQNAEHNRLIVAPAILWVTDIFLLFLLLTALHAISRLAEPDWLREPLDAFQTFKTRHFGTALAVAGLIGAAVVTTFAGSIRAGLGIATDVITYLNNYSWTPKAMADVERLRLQDKPAKYSGYWLRERIKDRLKVLAEQLISDENPDELVIVSHSQGTVVAMDVIDENGRDWLAKMKAGSQLSLVTMGSPFTNIHHHYFPSSFKKLSDRPNLLKRQANDQGGVISRWVNIFRIDDFVGTHVDPKGKWPVEVPVGANGHTYYWVDENVFPHLKEFVDFKHTAKIEAASGPVPSAKPSETKNPGAKKAKPRR